MENLTVPIDDEDRSERAEELLEACDTSSKADFGRELLDAAHEAWQRSSKSDPMAAVRDFGGDNSVDMSGYDPGERRYEHLTVAEVRALLRDRTEPTINPIHVPDTAGDEMASLKERVKLCLAVARHRHDRLSRQDSEEIVERMIGRGSNDYYISPSKADVPNKMQQRCYKAPYVPGAGVDRAYYTSAEAYFVPWTTMVSEIVSKEPSALSDSRVTKLGTVADRLAEQGEQLLVMLDDDGRMDVIEEKLDEVYSWGARLTEEAERRDLVDLKA